MLIVQYDPENGLVFADGAVLEAARKYAKEGGGITVSSELFIHALRLLVVRGEIPHTEVKFWFRGETMTIDEFGNLSSWPPEFCQMTLKFSTELLRAQVAKRKSR